jgi:hypothetical protein
VQLFGPLRKSATGLIDFLWARLADLTQENYRTKLARAAIRLRRE